MKKYIFLPFIFLFSSLTVESKVIDEVVAIVNNSVILKSEIDNLKKLVNINNLNIEKNNKYDSNLYNLLLDQIIIDKMSYQIALEKEIFIKESDIDKFIENVAKQNSITKNEFINKIKSLNINLNYYREFIRRKIANNILYNKEVKNCINISNKEIENLCKSFDSNKIINLFTYYDFDEIKISYDKKLKNIEKENNKKLADFIFKLLKKNDSIDNIYKLIDTKKNKIKIEKMVDKRLKHMNPIYISYFNEKIDVGSIIGPLFLEDEIYILKINKINKPDCDKLINEVNIAHIFIKKNIKEKKDIKNKILNIKKEIENKNISFSEAAKKYSCSLSSNNGGNLLWSDINLYDKDFIKKIKSLKNGEISSPFFYKNGWNLIKLIDSREIKYIDFIKNKYSFKYLFNKKFYESLDNWIKDRKKNTYIKIYNN